MREFNMRVFHKWLNVAGDRPPRYGKKRHVTVGRGPVPRQAAIAGDRPPRYGKKRHVTVGLGPSHATRAGERVSLAIVRATEKTSLVLFRSVGPECL